MRLASCWVSEAYVGRLSGDRACAQVEGVLEEEDTVASCAVELLQVAADGVVGDVVVELVGGDLLEVFDGVPRQRDVVSFADLLEVLDGLRCVLGFFLGAAELLHLFERLFGFFEDDVDLRLPLCRRGAEEHLQRDWRQVFHGLLVHARSDRVGVCEELLDLPHFGEDVLVELHLALGPVLDQEDVLVQRLAELFQAVCGHLVLLLWLGLLDHLGLRASGLLVSNCYWFGVCGFGVFLRFGSV